MPRGVWGPDGPDDDEKIQVGMLGGGTKMGRICIYFFSFMK